MTTNRHAPLQRMKKRKISGMAAVEFAFMVPLLILLTIPMFDLARIIQADLILINLSREGANLALRLQQCPDSSQAYPQCIMDKIAEATPPLDMAVNGMIYISKIIGNGPGKQNLILEQYRWNQGANQNSRVWPCSAWAVDGKCSSIPGTGSPINDAMANQLDAGEVIYVVEGLYHHPLLFGSMNLGFGVSTPQFNPDLYSKTIF